MIRELSVDEVVRLHGELEEIHRGSGDPIFPPGIKNRGLLEAAVKRPFTAAFGHEHFPGLEQKAAILVWSMICYHPFHNGNKRTAIAALRSFLQHNDHALVSDSEDIIRFSELVVGMCEDRTERPYDVIAAWIVKHCLERISTRERRWRDVLADLKRFGIGSTYGRGFIHLKRVEGPVLTLSLRGFTSLAQPSTLRLIRKFFAI